ncbi:protein NLRC3 isoform X2 [Austrofundulus limnaeus]|uniref:Protein NLRC3 isoform X2 n=1 Tax=Austrofundulus limnaeus TaxID=52670 RepID=A0A2I4D0M9_AUSLI|nr:PREDICTED: protein NLRC3-like isoform X2 [Austrofundulus limnaeus]
MSRAEKKEEAGLSSNDRPSEDHDNQERHKRSEQKNINSPTPSIVSLKSNQSMGHPLGFKESEQKDGNSPTPSVVSLKSNQSMGHPLGFKESEQKDGNSPTPSVVSLKSNQSMGHPLGFKESEKKDRNSPTPSVVSLKSNQSMGHPLGFENGSFSRVHQDLSISNQTDLDSIFVILEKDTITFVKSELRKLQRLFGADSPKNVKSQHDSEEFFCESQAKEALLNIIVWFLRLMDEGEVADTLLKSDFIPSQSEENDQDRLTSNDKPCEQQVDWNRSGRTPQKVNLNSVFKILEEKIICFVKNELNKFRKLLNLKRVCNQGEEQVFNYKEEEQEMINKEAFLNITLQFLRRMKQEELAYSLLNKNRVITCHCQLKSNLKKRSAYVLEGMAKADSPTLLNKIYTELYVVEGNTAHINRKHEVKLIEKVFMKPARAETKIRCEDIFKPFTGREKPIRTVMTEGVAGIGKTVLTQKFALDWAEGKANQNFQFIFPVSFRELNMIKQKEISLIELIHLFFSEIKEAGISSFEEFQVLFIFDGLDECRFPLNLNSEKILTDVTEPTSLDVLLTNLIRGRLLPSARIWITTRPAAAYQIPPELVDLVTDVRGFSDLQKEEYFTKRFTDGEQTRVIFSHIKKSRSLYIMCHIPVFCWISATVLQDAFKSREKRELPTSLTEMYVNFLMVLSKVKMVKYDEKAETDSIWSPETRKMIQALGKLSFEQLMKGNLFFYESDLMDCGIDVRAASLYSGVFTEIFQEERVLFNEKMFCFVHLSVQEFLAALHVHLTFINTGVNLLSEEESTPQKSKMSTGTLDLFYQSAVDKALQSHGHLDLLLRFLLGLSLKNNQALLKGLLTEKETENSSSQNTVQYIKKKISQNVCILKTNNLFYCLSELKDCSLIDEIQQTLKSGRLPTDKLPPALWAALGNVLLSSEDNLDVFELKNYYESDEAVMGLVMMVVNCTKAVLSCCNLTEMCCSDLACALKAQCFALKKLDLSNNDLKDSGVKMLCDGLHSPNCTLEMLSLSGCLITKEGCAVLASSLGLNCAHLKELDLSYNHPEESGVKLLSAGLEDPNWALQALRIEPGGSQYLKPGLRKYACELVLDSNTAHRDLVLSDNNRKVTIATENPPYPDHPERFVTMKQLLGKDGLTGRCYWEVEWRGSVYIAVTYKGIKRRGGSNDSSLGANNQSWCLLCSEDGHSVLHNNKMTHLQGAPSNRVGVYLDWPGGSLSFFRVSSDKKTHLYTFTLTFTEPVYPAFRVETEPLNSFVFVLD